MALRFIDQEGEPVTVYSQQEETFRKRYHSRTGTLDGWEQSLRQSKINQQIRQTFGLVERNAGPVLDYVSAPSDAEISSAIRSEPQQVQQSMPTPRSYQPIEQPDSGEFYQNPGVVIGLSLY